MAIIDSIKDKLNNIIYPKTVTKAVYDADTSERLDNIIESLKISTRTHRGCLLNKTVNQPLAHQTRTNLTWQNAVYDTDGFWKLATPDRITIPSGVKKIRLQSNVVYNSSSSVGDRFTGMKKNNTYFTGSGNISLSGGSRSANIVSAVINVVEGDYFIIWAEQLSGGTLDVLTDSGYSTWFALEVIE